MPRLIDADALKMEILCRLTIVSPDVAKYANGVLNFIANASTIEAEPVRYGRVIVHDGFEDEYYEYCSECKSKDVRVGDNYCPNCGAKLDKEA